ncbi:MAG: hypothetical protein BWY63_01143 [Chloroflexi bacterium ADurb.Bin360]|nr:MAG: hypothetical protein BWY63_01143 [Chloroflexi bacterium ADurb.Bin360]
MTDGQILSSHLAVPLFVGMVYIGYLLRMLSQRMGAVTKMPRYYRWFDLGNALITLATLSYTFINSSVLAGRPSYCLTPQFSLLTFHLPIALGVAINGLVALKYWGWLAKQI